MERAGRHPRMSAFALTREVLAALRRASKDGSRTRCPSFEARKGRAPQDDGGERGDGGGECAGSGGGGRSGRGGSRQAPALRPAIIQ
jgi:uncharacterized membrane protein YgcG